MAGEVTPRDHLKPAWQPGQSGNPAGRPKGARNKLGEKFLEDMYADFKVHGPSVIAQVREEKPDQYLKVVASILPKEIEAGERLGNMLDDILERIDGRTREIVPPKTEARLHS